MLRTIEGYTPEQWDEKYVDLRTKLKFFRLEAEAFEKHNHEEAILALAKVDGYIAIFAIIAILGEIKLISEKQILEKFKALSDKNLYDLVHKNTMREVFHKCLDADVRVMVENHTNSTRMQDLTEQKVKDFIAPMVGRIYDQGIKKYLKIDVTDESTAEMKQLLFNHVFLLCAEDLYKELDERQTAKGYWALTRLMGPFLLKKHPAEALQLPFIALRECAKLVQVNKEMEHGWREVALWLESLYRRSYLQIPEQYRKDGKVSKTAKDKMPTVNAKDEALQSKFGLTLYEIACYHLSISKAIQSKYATAPTPLAIPTTISTNPTMPPKLTSLPATAVATLAATKSAPVLASEPIVAPSVAHATTATQPLPIVSPSNVAAVIAAASSAPTSSEIPAEMACNSDAEITSALASLRTSLQFFAPKKSMVSAFEKEVLPFKLLDDIKDVKDHAQFSMLIGYLRKYRLCESQIDILKEFKGVIISTLKQYTGAYFNTHYIPTLIWARPHTQLVDETIKSIEAAEDPREHIITLFALWVDVNGKGSSDLITKVSDLLKSAFTILHMASQHTLSASQETNLAVSR